MVPNMGRDAARRPRFGEEVGGARSWAATGKRTALPDSTSHTTTSGVTAPMFDTVPRHLYSNPTSPHKSPSRLSPYILPLPNSSHPPPDPHPTPRNPHPCLFPGGPSSVP